MADSAPEISILHSDASPNQALEDCLEAKTRHSQDYSMLPSDVWALIISIFCQTYGHLDLANLTMTCRHLRSLALPSLFRSLCISTEGRHDPSPALRGAYHNEQVLGREHYEWTIEKLQFYASESIASGVTSCRLAAPSARRDPNGYFSSETVSEEFAPHIIDAFFDFLPQLPCLEDFTFEHISLTPFHLEQLYEFSELRNMHIVGCNSLAMDLPLLPVRQLWLGAPSTDLLATDRTQMLQVFASSDSLLILHIESHLLDTLREFTAEYVFPRLRYLEVHRPLAPVRHRLGIPLPSQMPYIPLPTEDTFPSLEFYSGPEHAVESFTQGGRVRHLALTQTTPKATPSKAIIDRLIHMGDRAAHLVSMELHIEDLTAALLSEICSRCVQLRALSLCAAERRRTPASRSLWTIDDVVEALRTALCRSDTLEFLEITSNYDWKSADPSAEQAIWTLRDDLALHPTLRYVGLSAWGSVLTETAGKRPGYKYAELFSARFNPCCDTPVREMKIERWRNNVIGDLDDI